jgi:hypothetical protein
VITIHRKDQIFDLSFVELENVNDIGKNYNNLPSHVKNLNNIQLLRRKLKLFLLQHNFYSVEGHTKIFYHGKYNCI